MARGSVSLWFLVFVLLDAADWSVLSGARAQELQQQMKRGLTDDFLEEPSARQSHLKRGLKRSNFKFLVVSLHQFCKDGNKHIVGKLYQHCTKRTHIPTCNSSCLSIKFIVGKLHQLYCKSIDILNSKFIPSKISQHCSKCTAILSCNSMPSTNCIKLSI
ncbi:hypothetical protein IscW_ISCW002587 [Ixodes scapularis]|uniref:Secreted protein n=1 Tax=Ixodes scapularis TaxID=6945 RepID=B7P7R5_IXOSC|nr:hypothetical protein IscW_ISCW002587 [Ixodes scapularis]|eukprot:XP_002399468.1 hypothetical protein IscW_ISCW002587 [Ixodes scapularis]